MLECEADGTFRRWPKNGEGIVSGSGAAAKSRKSEIEGRFCGRELVLVSTERKEYGRNLKREISFAFADAPTVIVGTCRTLLFSLKFSDREGFIDHCKQRLARHSGTLLNIFNNVQKF